MAGLKYYYVCCRDGSYRENKTSRKTEKCRPGKGKKPSRKLGNPCISRIYCTKEPTGGVSVHYIKTHTGHVPSDSVKELQHLPLPAGTKGEMEMKLTVGIPVPRIIDVCQLSQLLGNRFEYMYNIIVTYINCMQTSGMVLGNVKSETTLRSV